MNPLCCGCLSPSLFVFFSPVPYCWLPLLHSASSCEGKVYSVFKTCSLFSLVGVKLDERQSKVPPLPTGMLWAAFLCLSPASYAEPELGTEEPSLCLQ